MGKGCPTYQVVNLGCKVNRVESDTYESQLAQLGFEEAQAGAADLVVVNTCTVTADAEKKTRKAVRRALRENPGARVLVTGCSAAINGEQYAVMSDNVRVVEKAQMDERLPLEAAACARQAHPCQSLGIDRLRRGVKLQDGCDNACTFCIVHVARGPSHSVPPAEVLHACRELLAAGVPEIMLTGINLGAYEAEGLDLADLLHLMLDELPLRTKDRHLQARLRLSSIEPQNVTEKLAYIIAHSEGALCKHLHLPLQAGSSKVLHEMARHYDADAFMETVSMLRSYLPAVSLSTDIIAGFPGETEDDFQQSMQLAQSARFSKMHVFPYSVRTGTPAAARTDQIPPEVRDRRAYELRQLSDRLRAADLAARAGTTELVAVEALGQATTESYHDVTVPLEVPIGSLVPYVFEG